MILSKNEPHLLDLVGGKAKNLFNLEQQKIPVPPWMTITSVVYEEFQKSGKLPLAFESKLNEVLKKEFSNVAYFAVRSSATCEDSLETSFAGLLETYLFVPKQEIVHHIYLAFEAAKAQHLKVYTQAKKQAQKFSLALVVQQMVESDISGILFSADPRNSNRSTCLLSAGYGLGEGIVSDRVESDLISLNKETSEFKIEKLSTKSTRLIFNKKENRGLIEETVPVERQDKLALTQVEIDQLLQLALKIESFYQNHPQDIEWAIDQTGKIFITQTRPITTLKDPHFLIFDNSNVVESFPGINTPMTWSVVQIVYYQTFCQTLDLLKIKNFSDHYLRQLVGIHHGRIYYNLTSWYELMRAIPYTESYIKVWEKMMGIETQTQKIQKQNSFSSFLQFTKTIFSLVTNLIFLNCKLKKLEKEMVDEYNHFWQKENERERGGETFSSTKEFDQSISSFLNNIFKGVELTLINDIYAFVFTNICQWGINKETFNQLMKDMQEMDSLAPLHSLIQLSQLSKNNLKDENYQKLKKEHIEKFGDRGIGELKLETKTLREVPENLEKLIEEYATSNKDFSVKKDKKKQILYNPLFIPFLYLAKRSIVYREKFRLHRSRGYGVIRRHLGRMGKTLENKKIIGTSDDIYFLQIDELLQLSRGMSYQTNYQEIIQQRKHLFEKYSQQEIYTRLKYQDYQFCAVDDQIAETNSSDIIKGIGCSEGIVTGEIIVITDPTQLHLDAQRVKGKILVSPMTDPGWVFLMTLSIGLIVERGGPLSHTAIIGRELGIPTIVSVAKATTLFKNGQKITMNAKTGVIHHVQD